MLLTLTNQHCDGDNSNEKAIVRNASPGYMDLQSIPTKPTRLANDDLLPDVLDEDALVSDGGHQCSSLSQNQRTSAFQSFLRDAHYGPRCGIRKVFEIREGTNQLRHSIVRHIIGLFKCPRAVTFLESTQFCSSRLESFERRKGRVFPRQCCGVSRSNFTLLCW